MLDPIYFAQVAKPNGVDITTDIALNNVTNIFIIVPGASTDVIVTTSRLLQDTNAPSHISRKFAESATDFKPVFYKVFLPIDASDHTQSLISDAEYQAHLSSGLSLHPSGLLHALLRRLRPYHGHTTSQIHRRHRQIQRRHAFSAVTLEQRGYDQALHVPLRLR